MVFRRSDSSSKTYYTKIGGKKIALSSNKAHAEQLEKELIYEEQRKALGLQAQVKAKQEPRALHVIGEYLQTNNRFAPNTLKIIKCCALAMFGDGLNRRGFFGNVPLSSISEPQIHAFSKHSLQKLKFATVRQRIKYLRFFGKWAVELNYIRADQAPGKLGSKRYLPKEHRKEIQVPTRAEFDLVFNKLHKRFKPYVLTLLNTGMRRMELASAKVSWIEDRNGKLWINLPAEATKTRSARKVPILKEAQPIVRQAMQNKQPEDYLFESNPTLFAQKAGHNIRYWVQKLAIKNRFCLHSLRAMFICDLAVKAVPISQIARWCGQTINQCHEYAKINTSDSESLLEKAGL